MDALAEAGEREEALSLLKTMKSPGSGCKPDKRTYTAAIKAMIKKVCVCGLRGRSVCRVCAWVPTSGVSNCHTALCQHPSHQADIVEGRALFEEMVEEARIVPDAVTYTTLMELYGAAGQREQVGCVWSGIHVCWLNHLLGRWMGNSILPQPKHTTSHK